jgi:hypothetical protein
MERKILVDDLDGSIGGVETHTISIDGDVHEIDLTGENMDALRSAMEKFIAAARPRGGSKFVPTSSGVSRSGIIKKPARNDPEQLKKVREWASQHGTPVSKYGRIPQEVWDAYHKLAGRPNGKVQELVPPANGGRSIFSDAR